jgi:ribonuclease P protein subunit RPR2
MDIERWKSYLDFNRWNMKKGNRGRRGYRTSSIIHIAKERIEVLLNESEVMAKKKDLHYMRRYVDIAMAIGKKYNIRFPIEKKDHICKKCHAYLVYGVNSTVRVRNKKRVTHCMSCKHIFVKLIKQN